MAKAKPAVLPISPAEEARLAERRRVDEFMQQRLAERRAATMPTAQPSSGSYLQGLMNLINILTGQSPIQNNYGAKTNGQR